MSVTIYIHRAVNSELGALGGVKLSASQIKAYWLGAGGDPGRAQIMTAIALAESGGGYTGAVNPGVGAGGRKTNEYSVGLWQVNTLVHKNYTVEQLKDPSINAREAVRIYKLQGLRAWGSYTDGRYAKYMNAAAANSSPAPYVSPVPTAGGGSPSPATNNNNVEDPAKTRKETTLAIMALAALLVLT